MVQNGGGSAPQALTGQMLKARCRDAARGAKWREQFLYANSATTVTCLFRSPVVRHLPCQEVRFFGAEISSVCILLVRRLSGIDS